MATTPDALLAAFEKELLSEYREAVLKRLRASQRGNVPAGRHLLWAPLPGAAAGLARSATQGSVRSLGAAADAPTGPGVVKAGWLTKQGQRVRSWKRRWFVLRVDGVVTYYADETMQEELGTIDLDGYRVLDAPDIGTGTSVTGTLRSLPKAAGLRLQPGSDAGRVWPLIPDNDDERAEWVQAFTAASAAAEYVHVDREIEGAFVIAHRRVRAAHQLPARPPLRRETATLAAVVRDALAAAAPANDALDELVTSAWAGTVMRLRNIKAAAASDGVGSLGAIKTAEKEMAQDLAAVASVAVSWQTDLEPLWAVVVAAVVQPVQRSFGALVKRLAGACTSGTASSSGVAEAAVDAALEDAQVTHAFDDDALARLIAEADGLRVTDEARAALAHLQSAWTSLRQRLAKPGHNVMYRAVTDALRQLASDTASTHRTLKERGQPAAAVGTKTTNALQHDAPLALKEATALLLHHLLDAGLIEWQVVSRRNELGAADEHVHCDVSLGFFLDARLVFRAQVVDQIDTKLFARLLPTAVA